MAAEKKSYHKSVQSVSDYEIIENPELVEEASGACCVCDDPNTTQCAAESWGGSVITLASGQFYAYWLGR